MEIRLPGELPVDRDDVEDALNEALAGIGEVSGAGSGAFGSHLDVDIDPTAARGEVVARVLTVLDGLGLAGLARIRPGDGTDWLTAGPAQVSRVKKGTEPMEWITTGGGPLIAVPESVLRAWQGADEESDDEETGDYGRACAVTEYASLIDVAGAPALVLGDDPAPTAFLPEQSLFVRRSAANSPEAALAAVGQALERAEWEEAPTWAVPGPVLLFDAAYAAGDLGSTRSLRLDLVPGHYRVESAYVEPDEDTWLVLIRLTASGQT
ncbi:Imm21 family immunity protein [Streptomyces sp. NPDC055749]